MSLPAGRGGGVLFVVLVLFVAYLAAEALAGLLRTLATVGLLVVAAALTVNVIRQR